MSGGDAVKDGVDKLLIHDDDDIDSNYKPPPEKTIEELLNADKEDASLQKYKEKLLGGVANSGKIIFGNRFLFYTDTNNSGQGSIVKSPGGNVVFFYYFIDYRIIP